MQDHHRPNDDSWENDPVWKLLDQVPPATASPRFADHTLRAARLTAQRGSWWSRLLSPAPLAALGTAAAACAIMVISLQKPPPSADPSIAAAAFSEIQEIAETEILLSAVENLDSFSDVELVRLIGF